METAAEVPRTVTQTDDDSLERLSRLPERLQKREQERQREVERKKLEKEGLSVLEEKSSHFSASFGPERAAIEQLLAGNDRGVLEEVAERLQRLHKLLNDSMRFLPSYDIRQAQEALGRLQEILEEKRQLLQPKKKFAFKNRKKDAPAASADQTPGEGAPQLPAFQQPPADPPTQAPFACGVQGLTSQVLFMEAAEIQQKDVLLSQLRDCSVTLHGSPATLHLRGLHGCRVLCGPVSSSVFVDSCTGCLFSFSCQQLRTHSTSDTRFYLHVTSRAIIEDCHDLHFAPFTWTYEGIEKDYQVSGLDRARNNWQLVDDFNWLAHGVQSPNWEIIPEEDRLTHWN
ncbi:tubulin-specific chaperone C [Spea bombifrons]|uniref:tubulin-specific chaperone C n=1 Tax=Spea bombifrons TaxID=233779 RepID=UPI00234A96DC|nr:tubulin-specific chaperone C [Spea bombifrons]